MIKKIVLGLCAAAAIAAAAGVLVVAAAVGLYAVLEPRFGAAGSAGMVALAAAVLIALVGVVAWLQIRPVRAAKAPPQGDMLARAMNLARERPIIAAAGVMAAAVIAMRNPALTAVVVKGFMDSKKPPKR